VLLLEPDVAIAALITDILTDAGYAVDHLARPDSLDSYLARRGHPACDLLLSTPYTDPLHAPYAWLDALRAQVPVPIVICGRYPARLFADYRQRGYAAYLEEPFAPTDLVALVDAVCAALPLVVAKAAHARPRAMRV
jgi:DNA-binding response OmpR family regulator